MTFAARIAPGTQLDPAKAITLDVQTPANAKGLTIEVRDGRDSLLATFTGDLVKGVFHAKTANVVHEQDGIPKIRLNFRGAETKVHDLGIQDDADDEGKLFWEIAFTIKQGGAEVFKSQSVCQVRRLLVRFLAMDGTRSPDADSFARNMAKLKGAWNVGSSLPASHVLAPYLRRTKGDAVLAFNFQQNPENAVDPIVSGSDAHQALRKMAVTSSVPLAPLPGTTGERATKASFLYLAFHAYLDGGIAFGATNEKDAKLISVYNPQNIERPQDPLTHLDWTGVKWVVIAACGELSPHYRWFGIPHENYLDHTDDDRLCLCTRANFLNWLHLLRQQAKKGASVHGILGYWTKAPGGDSSSGETVDARVARTFAANLAAGKSIPQAWAEANPAPTDGWVVLCDERFQEETWDDLRLEKIADSPAPEKGPTYLYSDRTFTSGAKPSFVTPKTAFLEGNKAANLEERKLNGSVPVKVHPVYDRALKGDQVPKDLAATNWSERVFLREAYGDERQVVHWDEEKKRLEYLARCWCHPTVEKQLKLLLPDITDDEIAELHPKHAIKVLLTGFVDFPAASITNHPYWFDQKQGAFKPASQRIPLRNSSGYAVSTFDATTIDKKVTGDCELTIVKIVDLAVAYQRAAKLVVQKIADERPDIVISFGWGADKVGSGKNQKQSEADLETVASNLRNDWFDDDHLPTNVPPARFVLPPPAVWPPLAKGRPENWTPDERGWLRACPDNDRVSYAVTPIDDQGPDFAKSSLPVTVIAKALEDAGQFAYVDTTPTGGAGHYVCNEVFYTVARRQADNHALGGFIHLPDYSDDSSKQQKLVQVVKVAVEQTVRFLRETKH